MFRNKAVANVGCRFSPNINWILAFGLETEQIHLLGQFSRNSVSFAHMNATLFRVRPSVFLENIDAPERVFSTSLLSITQKCLCAYLYLSFDDAESLEGRICF
jgi:hypothetical protein